MKVFEVRNNNKVIRAIGLFKEDAEKIANLDNAMTLELATVEDYLKHETDYQCAHKNTLDVGDDESLRVACLDCKRLL